MSSTAKQCPTSAEQNSALHGPVNVIISIAGCPTPVNCRTVNYILSTRSKKIKFQLQYGEILLGIKTVLPIERGKVTPSADITVLELLLVILSSTCVLFQEC